MAVMGESDSPVQQLACLALRRGSGKAVELVPLLPQCRAFQSLLRPSHLISFDARALY